MSDTSENFSDEDEEISEELREFVCELDDYFTTNKFYIGSHYKGHQMSDAMCFNGNLEMVCHPLKVVDKNIIGVDFISRDREMISDEYFECYQTEELHLKVCDRLNEILGKYFPMRIIPDAEEQDNFTVDKGPSEIIHVYEKDNSLEFGAMVTVFYMSD